MPDTTDMYNDDFIDGGNDYYSELWGKIDLIAAFYGVTTDQIRELKEATENLKKSSIAPGVQFIIMHYCGMLDFQVKSNIKAGELLKALLQNGNTDDFRHWFSRIESQKRSILKGEAQYLDQPFTLKNMKEVCRIFTAIGLKEQYPEAFRILDILESSK